MGNVLKQKVWFQNKSILILQQPIWLFHDFVTFSILIQGIFKQKISTNIKEFIGMFYSNKCNSKKKEH